MKLTIIGCSSAYPTATTASSCYLLETANKKIVLELGSGGLMQLQRYIDLKDIDAVIISHYHPDHYSDIFCLQHAVLLQYQMGLRSEPLPIYGQEISPYLESLNYHDMTIPKVIDEHSVLTIDGWKISFLKTKHTSPGLAIKFSQEKGSIVYTSDTEISSDLIEFAKGVDILLTECSLYEKREIVGHMDVDDVQTLLEKARPKQAIITHLPVYGNHQDIYSTLINNQAQVLVSMAKPGLIGQI